MHTTWLSYSIDLSLRARWAHHILRDDEASLYTFDLPDHSNEHSAHAKYVQRLTKYTL